MSGRSISIVYISLTFSLLSPNTALFQKLLLAVSLKRVTCGYMWRVGLRIFFPF